MVVWRRWVFPILLVAVFGLIAASLVKMAFFPDDARAAAELPAGAVSDPIVAVSRGDVVNAMSLNGTIARDEAYALKADIEGTVTEVKVGDGQSVTAGQALFTIKRADNSRLVDVTAPEAGELAKIAVVKGQPATIGAELASLTPARYHVLATVQPVQLYRLLNAPSQATVTITGGPAPFTCTGVTVQVAEDNTTSVRCAIPGEATVFAGLPATVDLTIGSVTGVLVVPTTAVKGGASSGIVWVDPGDGSAPTERTVSLGINDGTSVEVTDGLAEGDMIRQFAPGTESSAEEICYDDGRGGQFCETGTSW
ncbi:efflux RND transporter periplasmic adaptor subunit [Microbacterium sp. SORGH_AS_0888]|uniref:efflux RND transporter periplasmic adaptor subunit n=1 Tax=Microbacterium sp. SORGH_AS_0888 TaxID=3041791 RepID=UPI0027811CBB|nr:biotin/lipoyl-binding protein [Microbacterium sp. SORGH_AS_0888]MDQ1127930.1 multidrug efflux pump subunit AcrA (membrane-fusion protein) [Microbacterium sp. SORGH_AS_0888]